MTAGPSALTTGYVLAGGQSSRMGRDKALLDDDGKILLQRALDVLRAVCSDAYILSGPRQDERDTVLASYADLVPDSSAGHAGPLAGLIAALRHCRTPYACLITVDQPGILASHLQALLAAALLAGAAVTSFQQADGAIEPLPVVLSSHLRLPLEQQWQAGERRFLAALQAAAQQSGCAQGTSARRAVLGVLLPSDSGAALTNLNSPSDLAKWRSGGVTSNQSPPGASE